MLEGKLNRARRGELDLVLPTGHVHGSGGEIAFDPDAQVQQGVRFVFRKFEQLGTLKAVLRYLVAHGIGLGIRVREKGGRGELEWHRPDRMPDSGARIMTAAVSGKSMNGNMMNFESRLTLAACAFVALLSVSCRSAQTLPVPANTVVAEQWSKVELVLHAAGAYENPYTDVDVHIEANLTRRTTF